MRLPVKEAPVKKALPKKGIKSGKRFNCFCPESFDFDLSNAPEWFLFLWGFIRAYCERKIRVSLRDDLQGAGEVEILRRLAGIIERDWKEPMSLADHPLRFVPRALREIASAVAGEHPHLKPALWKADGRVFARRLQ